MFQTPLLKIDPEVLNAVREESRLHGVSGPVAALALGWRMTMPAGPDPQPRGFRYWTKENTYISADEDINFDRLVQELQEQGLGFAILTVRDRITPPEFMARVFEYVGVNATNSQKAVGKTMEEALNRAFVAFHEATLLRSREAKPNAG